jgi:hypothetical protein
MHSHPILHDSCTVGEPPRSATGRHCEDFCIAPVYVVVKWCPWGSAHCTRSVAAPGEQGPPSVNRTILVSRYGLSRAFCGRWLLAEQVQSAMASVRQVLVRLRRKKLSGNALKQKMHNAVVWLARSCQMIEPVAAALMRTRWRVLRRRTTHASLSRRSRGTWNET